MTRLNKCAAALLVLPAILAGCGGESATQVDVVNLSQTVDKSAAFVGDRVTWTVTAVNPNFKSTLTPTVLTLALPANISAVSITPTNVTCGAPTTTLTCTINSGFATGINASVVVSGVATANGSLTASVNGANCKSASDCTSTTTITTRPNVGVSASVSATSALVGDTLNWTITAANTGGVTTAPFTFTDTFPATGLGAVSVTPNGASCAPITGNTLTCTVPAGLAANNGVASVVLSAPTTAAASMVNTVVPGTGATCATLAACTTTTTVAPPATPNVIVSNSVDKTSGSLGDVITWTLKANNVGTGPTTTGIILTDTLPSSGIGTPTVTPSAGVVCNPVSGNTLTCTVPAGLAAGGGVATVQVASTVTGSGNLVNTVAPGAGASCNPLSACTTTTAIAAPPVQIAGSCGVMIDAATLNIAFGGASGTMVPMTVFGTTFGASGGNSSVYLVGLASTGDPAVVESWPAPGGVTGGPAANPMLPATGTQFICASQNASGTTGSSNLPKFSTTTPSASSLAANFQLSKLNAGATLGGFVMFNLPSLSNFSFEFYRNSAIAYQLDYSLDGSTWTNIATVSRPKTNAVNDEINLLTSAPSGMVGVYNPVAPISRPVLLRLSNMDTGGTMAIQKIMIKP